jgi:hypothetical protein
MRQQWELAALILSDLNARAHEDDWGVLCVYPDLISEKLAAAIIAAGWKPCNGRHVVKADPCGFHCPDEDCNACRGSK